MGVRCLRCLATPVTLSLIAALRRFVPNLDHAVCYELSGRGALVRHLRKHAGSLTVSEYFEDVRPGDWKAGVQCQDVMALTYPDASFDLCTCTEVFEHVAEDATGFREIHRVLRPGGCFVFTVPLSMGRTVTRAVARGDSIEHLLPAEYHSDRIRGSKRVLCFRDYGLDLPDRLLSAGFASAEVVMPLPEDRWFGFARPVVLARRPGSDRPA